MKTKINQYYKTTMLSLIMVSMCLSLSACTDKEITRPEVTTPLIPDKEPVVPEVPKGTIKMTDVTIVNVFNSGSDNINSFRIPSIVTAKDGSLLVFGEARHTTWKDKSYTDVVVKHSTDNGTTWGAMVNLTASINTASAYAFMDPVAVVDKVSGKIWVYFVRWPKDAGNALNNLAFVATSSDNGLTWSVPADVTDVVTAPGCVMGGFGPGSGFQISEGKYKGRIIVPTRQFVTETNLSQCATLYSDDSGVTWKLGENVRPAGESQIAYCGNDKLTLNVRALNGRTVGSSMDGGEKWSKPNVSDAAGLPGIAGGCQASVLGVGKSTVLFCGIKGGVAINTNDDRSNLTLYRSLDGAATWTKNQLLWGKASGYCCMTMLNDGRLAIVFEAAEGTGFTKDQTRLEGWMRLDVMILPKEVTDQGYWF